MKKVLLLISLASISMLGYSQTDKGVISAVARGGVATTFVTDYQALGINPSNLGWEPEFENKRVTFGLSETNLTFYSEALNSADFKNSLTKIGTDLTEVEKSDMAVKFANNAFAMNVDIKIFGGAVQTKKIGGFAFSINNRFSWYSKFSSQMADLMFNGNNSTYFDGTAGDGSKFATNPQNLSDLIAGTRVSTSWYQEYNLGYGLHVFTSDIIDLYGGVGIKYLNGLAIMDLNAENGNFNNSFAAVTPLIPADYASISINNPSLMAKNSGVIPNSVGSGMGYDIGVNAILFKKLRVGVAVNDIGSITWNGNAFSIKDYKLTTSSFKGINSSTIVSDMGKFLDKDGIFQWSGQTKRTISLPTVTRIGASYNFFEKLDIGVDMVIPANNTPGNLTSTFLGFGVDFRPVKWFKVSSGVSGGGNYNTGIPLGITFNAANGTWETGFATRDITNYFRNDKPTYSFAFGFLRFRIGKSPGNASSEDKSKLL